MPNSYDMRSVVITNHPTQRLDTATQKLPPLDLTTFTTGLVNLLKDLTGIDLSSPEAFVTTLIHVVTTGGPALEFAGAIVTMIGNFVGIPNLGAFLPQLVPLLSGGGIVQQIIDAIVAGTGGGTTTGNDPASILFALAGQGLSLATLPLQLADQIWAQLAHLTSVQTAAQNNPGSIAQSDDYATVTLAGRQTNIQGTVAISTRGNYLQSSTIAADYLGTPGAPRKPLTNKCFIEIVLDGVMDGVIRAWFCGDNAMANYAALEIELGFGGDAVRIVTGSSPSLVAAQAQVDLAPGRLVSGTAIKCMYDPDLNKFIVLRNMQAVGLEWKDLGASASDPANIVTHTTAKTFGGSVLNAADRDDDGFWGPGIAKRTLGDW